MKASIFFFFIISSVSAQQQRLSSFSSSDLPWRPNQNKALFSSNSLFAAGFSRLSDSSNLFRFSIWYLNVTGKSAVWYASKSPVTIAGELSVTSSGELRLGNTSTSPNLWPSKSSQASSSNLNSTKLVLNDEGNLVFGNWDSFDFPTDTILPNQTITGREITSENGRYSFRNGTNLFFNRTDRYWTANAPFARLNAAGKMDQLTGASLVTSDFGLGVKRRLTIDDDGNLRIYGFDPELRDWSVVWHATHELCTIHGKCGPNAICTSDGSNSSACVCPPGFSPTGSGGAKDGCSRDIQIRNPRDSKFVRLDYVNFTGDVFQELTGKNLGDCEANCTANLNCVGFQFKYDGQGSCVLLNNRLFNGYWSPGTEAAFFLRVDSSENSPTTFKGMTEILDTTCPVLIELPFPPDDSDATTRNIAIICTLFAAELISGALFFWAFLKKYIKYRDMARTLGLELLPAGGPKRFSYSELKIATGNFSNLIGRGGFGDVYRGELADRRTVAVKCLRSVAGGEPDFWAEVTIIARMHHLNLVRLWGFCAEKGQKILVYEYVPNGSLDRYLFNNPCHSGSGRVEEKPVLDWSVRYRISLGVARAMAYLHEECLEWVLHCDIKPENILLGDDFCPKISDFGLSKLRKKEDIVSLSKIRGTRGYMAPEWVKSDTITAKADVYSFGMVLLELVSGVRNNQVQGSGAMESEDWYFPGWAFDKVYKEVRVEDILDHQIKMSYDSRAHFEMVNRMVKTAMWCLQSRPEVRPSMGKVAKMLEGTVEITEPKKPTIFFLGDE